MGRDPGLPLWMGKANESTLAALEVMQALNEGLHHPMNCEIGAVGAASAPYIRFHHKH